MRQRLYSFILMLSCLPAFAQSTCPEVSSISRIPGEYAWVSSDGRWEGYFASPRTGRGSSTAILGFAQVRWIKLNDLLKSPGIIECDYVGNSMGEIIRFVSSTSDASAKPTNINWTCEFNPEIPGLQCNCTGETRVCVLESN